MKVGRTENLQTDHTLVVQEAHNQVVCTLPEGQGTRRKDYLQAGDEHHRFLLAASCLSMRSSSLLNCVASDARPGGEVVPIHRGP